MMYRKRIFAVLVVLGISVCGTVSSTVVKYNFSQSGYDEGAIVTGMFSGDDLNDDGFLVGNEGPGGFNEVTAFNMAFSGNSIVPAFTLDFSDFSNSRSGPLVYNLSDGPFLGDDAGGSGETLIVIVPAAGGDFGILLGGGECNPNITCGDVFSEGVVTQSFELMKVSAVPLPAAVWLFSSGLLGLFGMKQIKVSTKFSLT